MVVENRTGAGGNIGAEVAAQAEPDGYTMFVSAPGPLAINHILYKKLSYKPADFVPITLIGSVPNLVIVRKDLPVNSVKELIDYIKQNAGKLVYGSQGSGNTPHLTANMFMTMTGTSMIHVPIAARPWCSTTCWAAARRLLRQHFGLARALSRRQGQGAGGYRQGTRVGDPGGSHHGRGRSPRPRCPSPGMRWWRRPR